MTAPRTKNLTLLGAGFALLAIVAGIAGWIIAGNQPLGGILGPAPVEERCEASAGEYSGQLSPDQAGGAALIAQIARERRLPARAVTIGIATAMQESGIRNLGYGDRDSLGMFQQRPSQGWGTPAEVQDPVYAINAFFNHLVKVDGYQKMAITDAAQAVQRSGFPDAYAQHEAMARAFAAALTGQQPGALTCVFDPEAKRHGDASGLSAVFRKAFGRASLTSKALGDGSGQVLITLPRDGKGRAPAETTWAAASWLLVHAGTYGITEVQTPDGQLWRLASGAWEPTTRPALKDGTLLVSLAPAPGA